MRITPLDIQKHRFRKRALGYDTTEVRAFLASFAEQFEQVVHENGQHREQVALLREQLRDYEDRERVLKDTLVSAQAAADEIRGAARREAEVLIKEAELKAEKMMEVTRERLGKYEGRLIELRTLKRELVERVKSLVRNHAALLADWEEIDAADDNLEFLESSRRAAAEE